MRHPWLNFVILPVGILVAFFTVPLGRDEAPVGVVLGSVGALTGLVAVVYVVVKEARRSQKKLRAIHMLLLIEIVLVIFSIAYFGLAIYIPTEFSGLNTRLDALYFSMTTVSTVGYGDIHAVGQRARALVTGQLAFDLGFMAVIVGMLRGRLQSMRPEGHTY